MVESANGERTTSVAVQAEALNHQMVLRKRALVLSDSEKLSHEHNRYGYWS
jgi:hypothetical protein